MARTRRNTRKKKDAAEEPEVKEEAEVSASGDNVDESVEEAVEDVAEESLENAEGTEESADVKEEPVEGNGEEAEAGEGEGEGDVDDAVIKTEDDGDAEIDDAVKTEVNEDDHSRLVAGGCPKEVADLVREIVFDSEVMAFDDLSSDVIEILSQDFATDKLDSALKEFVESDFSTIKGDKSAHLLSLLKFWKDDGEDSKMPVDGNMKQVKGLMMKRHGPDEAKIKELLERTGYKHEVTAKGRVYGPPADVEEKPEHKQEIFVGKLARDVYEDELVPLFEKHGKIYDIKILIDPSSGFNRGFAFVSYCEKASLYKAAQELNDHEIRPGKLMKVNVSIPNQRLFVGNVPKQKSKEEIVEEFQKVSEGLEDVIVYSNPDDDKKRNRGFAFLEYSSHTAAANARQKFLRGVRAFGNSICSGDWADPEEEPDEETMKKVKILHVRNLSSDVSEEQLKKHFSEPLGEDGASKIAKVKKVKYNAFIEFNERDDAIKVMEAVNGTELGKQKIEVALAKPAADKDRRDQRRSRGGGMRGGGGGGRNRGSVTPRGGPRGGGMGGPRGRGSWNSGYGGHQGGGGWSSGGYGGHQTSPGWGGGYGGHGGWGGSNNAWSGPPPMRGPGGMGMSRGGGGWNSSPSGPPQRMGGGSWGGSGGGWGGGSGSGNWGGPSRGSWGGPGGMRGGFGGGGMRGGFGGRGGGMRGGRGGRGGQKRSRGGRSNGDGNGGAAKKPRLDGAGTGGASGGGDGATAGISNEGPAAEWGNQPIAQQPLSKADA